jgi:hypothetical protein
VEPPLENTRLVFSKNRLLFVHEDAHFSTSLVRSPGHGECYSFPVVVFAVNSHSLFQEVVFVLSPRSSDNPLSRKHVQYVVDSKRKSDSES